MKRSKEDVGWNLEHRLRKTRLRWYGHVKCKDENSIVKSTVELEVEGRRSVGSQTWWKVMEEYTRKLNINENTCMAEDRQ